MKKIVWIFGVLLLVVIWSPVSALEIRVRGDAKLQVDANAAGTVAQVFGILTDELQRSLAHRDVTIRIEDAAGKELLTRTTNTDASGRFSVQEEMPPGQYRVLAIFNATEHFDGVIHEGDIELTPASVETSVYGPNLVVGRGTPVFVYGQAMSAGIPFQGSAIIYVGEESAGTLSFDQSGRGSVDIVSALRPGDNTIRLIVPGSAYRDETSAETTIRFASELQIEAAMEERVERLSRGLSISGTVSDAFGPVPNLRMQGVYRAEALDDGTVALPVLTVSGVTDESGRFSTFVPWVRLGDGVWSGTARALPNVGESVEVEVQPVDVDTSGSRAMLNIFGSLVLLLGALVLLGSVGRQARVYFDQFREERARRRRSRQSLETQETIVPIFLDSSLPPTPDARHDVGGLAWNTWEGQHVGQAEVILTGRNGNTISAMTDERGRFSFGSVVADDYVLSVKAPGFVTGSMKLKVPHDGRYRSFRVDLVAVPLKIRRIYQSLLEEVSGEDPWGKLSPREAEEQMWMLFNDPDVPWASQEQREELQSQITAVLQTHESGVEPVNLLSVMTKVVEESYYSGKIYNEDIWMVARTMVLRLRARAGLEELP